VSAAQIRREHAAFTELEFEWIRQFYIQGRAHYDNRVWWHEPMDALVKIWVQFEARAIKTFEVLKFAATFDPNSYVEEEKSGRSLCLRLHALWSHTFTVILIR